MRMNQNHSYWSCLSLMNCGNSVGFGSQSDSLVASGLLDPADFVQQPDVPPPVDFGRSVHEQRQRVAEPDLGRNLTPVYKSS